jgi:MOB kinase activator 1
VYAHIYLNHYDRYVELKVEQHLGTSFKHFALFVTHFKLVPVKELAPMETLIAEITRTYSS